MKSWEAEGQESSGKDGKRTMGQSRAAATWAGEDAVPIPGSGGAEKLEKGTKDVPELNGLRLRDEHRPGEEAAQGGSLSVGSSCVFHSWLSQSIPHGWHRPRAAFAQRCHGRIRLRTHS